MRGSRFHNGSAPRISRNMVKAQRKRSEPVWCEAFWQADIPVKMKGEYWMEAKYVSIKQKESGRRIRTLMSEKGFSVRDIQEIMGFENPQAVYKWTSGKSLPSIDNLLILSRALGVHMDELLVTNEEPGLCA